MQKNRNLAEWMMKPFVVNKSQQAVQLQPCNNQAIDMTFQVWEHAQKSKIFLSNKACFLILLRIVFNFFNKKNSPFHALFLHFKY